MKVSTRIRKLSFYVAGVALVSSLLATTAHAQYERNSAEERRIQERKALHAENMRKYPYNEHTAGISMVKDDTGIQKCLRWVSWVPVYHRDRSPYIEHALYDIALMGEQMLEYQKLENENKMMPQSFFDNVQEKISRGQRAMDYCSQLPSVPDSFNPRYSGGR
jgi:hypothetical protein